MKFCSECGAKIVGTEQFCQNCGIRLVPTGKAKRPMSMKKAVFNLAVFIIPAAIALYMLYLALLLLGII
jgi:hypothetical protein